MTMYHTVRVFDADLAGLGSKIASMGGQAERLVDEAVAALVHGDATRARQAIADDMILDEAERWIDDRAVSLLARRQPMEADLREILGAIRIASDLERVGDLGKNIAKRVGAVSEKRQPVRLFRGLEALTGLALMQLKLVLDLYASRTVGRISAVRDRDEDIDAHYTSLYRELLAHMMEDPRNISAGSHLLFCAKNIERIGDHATNIAETVYHVVTGEQMPLERPKIDKSHSVNITPRGDEG